MSVGSNHTYFLLPYYGAKQSCALASTLSSLLFSCMLLDAFKDTDKGVHIHFQKDGGLFNLKRLQSITKTLRMLIVIFFM